MKIYSVSEFARAVGVTNVTVNNWIKSGIVSPMKSETNQYFFSSSQVQMVVANMHLQRKNQKGISALYIIKTDSDAMAGAALQNLLNIQKEVKDESVYIPSFETFFESALDKVQFDPNDETAMKALRGYALRELSRKLNEYVRDRILYIYGISKLYQDRFTWSELKAIILNDESKLTPELIAKFDDVKAEIERKPAENNLNMNGSVKKNHGVSFESLKILTLGKVADIIRSVGLTNPKLTKVNFASLLDISNISDPELAAILMDAEYPINLNAPEVQKYIKELTISTEKEAMRIRLSKAKNVGFFTVLRLREGDTESETLLYEYLDNKLFKDVFLMCAKADSLPVDIKRKIDIGVRNECFTFTVQGERSEQS